MSPGLVDSRDPWIIFERKRLEQDAAEKAGSPKAAKAAALAPAEPLEDAAPRPSAQSAEVSRGTVKKPAAQPSSKSSKPAGKPAKRKEGTAEQPPAKASKTAEPAAGESRDEVLAEFRDLLVKAGKSDGQASDGPVSRYPRFTKLLFDSGQFKCRSDFFADGAEDRAAAVYKKLAAEKFKKSSSNIPERKYLTNFMHGFNDFVKLTKA